MPARVFAITAASPSVTLNAQRSGQASFTVSNTAARAIDGRATIKPLKDAKQEWLSIAGEAERSFPPDHTEQFTVKIAVPPGAPPADCALSLNVYSVQNPEEDFAEGPTVSFEVKAPPDKPKPKTPAWVFVLILVVILLVGGVVTWLVLRKPPEIANTTPTPTEAPSVSVPDLSSSQTVKLEQAVFTLQGSKLKVGTVTTKIDNAHVDIVLGQDPPAGRPVKPGSEVNLTVGAFFFIPILKYREYQNQKLRLPKPQGTPTP